jgi:hypothetical protein
MTKIMAGAYLILKLICQRIEIDSDLVLIMWRNRPAIEIYEPGLSIRQSWRLHRAILPHTSTDFPIVNPFVWDTTSTTRLSLPKSSVQWPYTGRTL